MHPSCCPPDGTPVNPAHPASIALVGLRLTAVGSRDDIVAAIAPVTGALVHIFGYASDIERAEILSPRC